jgi:pimeloyl-ACP methyl ester carboxylesterase
MADQQLSNTTGTHFLELQPHHDASGIGVMVVPGAGWGASALREPAALLTEAGHTVVLCDPSGTVANPGPFRYDDLWRDCATYVAGWDVRRIVLLAHSMGAHTAACLAALDARIEQLWVAPVPDGRRCFATLYAAGQAGQLHHVLFEPPLSAAEHTALEVLTTDAWLHTAYFDTLRRALALPSHGGVRVPHLWDFLHEVAHPGYVLAPRDSVRLRGVLVPRDDAWVPLDVSRTFCAAAGVPLTVLSSGRGHAARGGWPEILETVRSFLADGATLAEGKTYGIA